MSKNSRVVLAVSALLSVATVVAVHVQQRREREVSDPPREGGGGRGRGRGRRRRGRAGPRPLRLNLRRRPRLPPGRATPLPSRPRPPHLEARPQVSDQRHAPPRHAPRATPRATPPLTEPRPLSWSTAPLSQSIPPFSRSPSPGAPPLLPEPRPFSRSPAPACPKPRPSPHLSPVPLLLARPLAPAFCHRPALAPLSPPLCSPLQVQAAKNSRVRPARRFPWGLRRRRDEILHPPSPKAPSWKRSQGFSLSSWARSFGKRGVLCFSRAPEMLPADGQTAVVCAEQPAPAPFSFWQDRQSAS